jgi:hypothetical protein
MKQYEAVIEVMKRNGGYATLSHLYNHVFALTNCNWKTKTPFASIRRIVQDDRFFYKIRPGLWALKSHQDAVTNKLFESESPSAKKQEEFDHSYYQGLLIEIGNTKSFTTFIPSQDKNRKFLSRRLGDVATAKEFPAFTYDRLLRRGRTIDVTWLNRRGFPHSFFEVEHSTDIHNSLLKFVEFQDFSVSFNIVAHARRIREVGAKLGYSAFDEIRGRVQVITYDELSEAHTKSAEAAIAMARAGL